MPPADGLAPAITISCDASFQPSPDERKRINHHNTTGRRANERIFFEDSLDYTGAITTSRTDIFNLD